jgi:hypothetical protein
MEKWQKEVKTEKQKERNLSMLKTVLAKKKQISECTFEFALLNLACLI